MTTFDIQQRFGIYVLTQEGKGIKITHDIYLVEDIRDVANPPTTIK